MNTKKIIVMLKSYFQLRRRFILIKDYSVRFGFRIYFDRKEKKYIHYLSDNAEWLGYKSIEDVYKKGVEKLFVEPVLDEVKNENN